ncbi:MAG: hypothetical protein J0H44_00320 [Alphaproteobacteria bacterium]|nr:hypothetical protein [Alphaproteobacteria bacterium]
MDDFESEAEPGVAVHPPNVSFSHGLGERGVKVRRPFLRDLLAASFDEIYKVVHARRHPGPIGKPTYP